MMFQYLGGVFHLLKAECARPLVTVGVRLLFQEAMKHWVCVSSDIPNVSRRTPP